MCNTASISVDGISPLKMNDYISLMNYPFSNDQTNGCEQAMGKSEYCPFIFSSSLNDVKKVKIQMLGESDKLINIYGRM